MRRQRDCVEDTVERVEGVVAIRAMLCVREPCRPCVGVVASGSCGAGAMTCAWMMGKRSTIRGG